jgi:lysophospholipase
MDNSPKAKKQPEYMELMPDSFKKPRPPTKMKSYNNFWNAFERKSSLDSADYLIMSGIGAENESL